VYALPNRFHQALEETIRSQKPEAVRISLPSAIVHSEKELDEWLDEVRARAKKQLERGPVIL
jgi:Tfp pilus assembly protein PilP